MRVIHLYDGHEQVYGGRGSVPGVVWNLARETAAADHDVMVLERRWSGLSGTTSHEGVSFERLNLRSGADEPWTRVPYEAVTSPSELARLVVDRTNFALRALRRLRKHTFDILHVHLPFAANVLATVAPRLRERMVYTAHLGELRLNLLEGGQDGGGSNPDTPSFLSVFSPDIYLSRRAARTTVLNPDIESVFVDRGVSESAVRVIPNGVDIERFGNVENAKLDRIREQYGFGNVPSLLFVGTLIPRKGVTELVQALDRIVNHHNRKVHVVLAGEADLDDSYVQRVETLIKRAGLDSHITMPGFVPAEDLPGLYHTADALVVPSLEEGFGMTAIEAMAAGTPVIGTRVGGLPEIVAPGRTGALAEPGDITGLADAIVNVFDMVADSETDTTRETRVTAETYSWPSITNRFVDIYEEVRT